jgi:hypothetical protein
VQNSLSLLDCVWSVMAHAPKPDFVFRQNGRIYLNRRGRQFSRLLAAEVCASAVVMLDTPRSEEVWRVLATHSICQFPLHFPSRASPCAITFQLASTNSSAPVPPIANSPLHDARNAFPSPPPPHSPHPPAGIILWSVDCLFVLWYSVQGTVIKESDEEKAGPSGREV